MFCLTFFKLNVITSISGSGAKLEVPCNFNAEKTRLVSFDQSNNWGAIDFEMDESVLEEKSTLKLN